MIPENDPFVESQLEPEEIVKNFLNAGQLPRFGSPLPTFTTQVEREPATPAPIIDLERMLQMVKQMEDDRWDREIKLLDALEQWGAMVTTSPFLSGDQMMVTLPERFEKAREERTRRRQARERAIDWQVQYGAPKPFVLHPNKPCAEMEA